MSAAPTELGIAEISAQLTARSAEVDQRIRRLYAQFLGGVEGLALAATGGYGRGELFPYSDVDVLLLSAEPLDPALGARVSAFFASLWTFAMEPAHSVRTLAEARADAATDLVFYTSLLDLRPLAGQGSLVRELRAGLHEVPGRSAGEFLLAKLDELRSRHARFTDHVSNLEPNLKDSPGGLRDLHTLGWVGMRCYGDGSLATLRRVHLLEPAEARRLREAGERLVRMRYELHRLAGRKQERVVFDLQPRLAEAMGVRPSNEAPHVVETLMQGYFRAARVISTISQRVLERLRLRLYPGEIGERIADGFRFCDGRIEADQEAPLTDAPLRALAAARQLAARPAAMGFGAGLVRYLERAQARLAGAAWRRGEVLERFVELLKLPGRAAPVLNALARAGVLGQILPAFERVTGRMQYDLFHVYTVDEHTLKLIRRLDELWQAPLPELPRAQDTFRRIRKPELLYLAGLFHDIAKGRGGDHSILGAEDAREFMAAAGMNAAETALVAWLVEEHLTMSIIAQKQDIADPEVVRGFAVKVADRERLDYLFLLTCADIHATSPKLWNGWKARLLGDLYTQTRFWLRRGVEQPIHADERTRSIKAAATELLRGEGVLLKPLAACWDRFPPESFLSYSPEEIRWQTQALLGQGEDSRPLVAVRAIGGAGFQIFVHAVDRDGLFATIAAALDRVGMSVAGARIASRDGRCFNTFAVQDTLDGEANPRDRAIDVQMALDLALAEDPLQPRLSRRAPTRMQKQFRFAPGIEIETLGTVSQVTLVASDRPGILARVAMAFRDCRLTVHSAKIATFGERVEDFFRVTTAAGQPLDPTESAQLAQTMRLRLKDLEEL